MTATERGRLTVGPPVGVETWFVRQLRWQARAHLHRYWAPSLMVPAALSLSARPPRVAVLVAAISLSAPRGVRVFHEQG